MNMKIQDIPKSGKCGLTVAWRSRFGLCLRAWVPQKPGLTPARQEVCTLFGYNSQSWGTKLSDEQQERWILSAAQVMSHPRLAAKGPLTGQQLWTGISTTRSIVGLPETLEVPPRPVFGPSNLGPLIIENDENGLRLYVLVTGDLPEDIMLFAQAPCSRGRYKRRNVSYIGLLPPSIGGRSEISQLYKSKFGAPRAGQKVFLVTCQQKEGWKGFDRETSATVPENPCKDREPKGLNKLNGLNRLNEAPSALPQPATSAPSHIPYMHTGCPPDAQGQAKPLPSQPHASNGPATGGENAPPEPS
jgi:hypothetical protein